KGINWQAKVPSERKVLLFGVSNAAESFIRSARRSHDSGIMILGVFDDDPTKYSRLIHGVKVLGALGDIRKHMERLARRGIRPTELIVTENKPSRQRLTEILAVAATVGLKVTRIPDITVTSSITSHLLLKPKPIELEDLLGRPEVTADLDGIARLINGR